MIVETTIMNDYDTRFNLQVILTPVSSTPDKDGHLDVYLKIIRTCKKCGDQKDFQHEQEIFQTLNVSRVLDQILQHKCLGYGGNTRKFQAPCKICAGPEFEIAN